MKVLVTGSTGFVGGEIARQLHLANHPFRALVRNPKMAAAGELSAWHKAEIYTGDILDPPTIAKAMVGIDAVIHLVGIISEVGRCTFENIHARGTENVVAAARQAGVRRFVQMSALGTRPEAISRYHQSKWAGEECVRRSGLEATVFRPSLIYGPRDQFVNLFARMIRLSPVVPVIGNRASRFQPVSVAAVGQAFVGALTKPGSIGKSYDLCGPDTLTMEGIVDEIMKAMGRRRWKMRVPRGLARLQATLLEWFFPRVLRRAPPLNRDQLIMLNEDNVGNARPANEMFDLKHPRFREGIGEYLADRGN
jgi:uncharacterized protein YbjT (DUF2867 family)